MPTSNISPNLGLTWIQDDAGNWKPLKGLWYKNASGDWVPVRKGWRKGANGLWEQIYPTPRGAYETTESDLTFSLYHNYDSETKSFTIRNTGDYQLIITNIEATDGNTYTSTLTHSSLPITIPVGGSTTVGVRLHGDTAGSSDGSITITNDIGYLGTTSESISISAEVLENYSGIILSPTTINFTYYEADTPPSANVTITNNGNGGHLLISNVVVPDGMSTSTTPTDIGYNWDTHTNLSGSFTLTAPTQVAGTYFDTLYIESNAPGKESVGIPVKTTVQIPHGSRNFTTPGTQTWAVPQGVHSMTFTVIGGGGGGGGGTEVGNGGGGGGGGSGAVYTVTKTVTPGEILTITVGDGGAGAPFIGRTTSTPGGSPGIVSTVTGSFGIINGGSGGAGQGGSTPSYYDDSPPYYGDYGGGDGQGSDSGGGSDGGGDGD